MNPCTWLMEYPLPTYGDLTPTISLPWPYSKMHLRLLFMVQELPTEWCSSPPKEARQEKPWFHSMPITVLPDSTKPSMFVNTQVQKLMDEIIPGGLDPTWTANTNWNDKVFGLGSNKVINSFCFRGTDKSRYLLSGNYLKSDGIVKPVLLKGIHYASISTTTSGHGWAWEPTLIPFFPIPKHTKTMPVQAVVASSWAPSIRHLFKGV